MKLLLLFIISFSSFAEDNVRDLMFFPDQGTLWGQTSYESAEQSFVINDNKTKATGVEIRQTVSYIPTSDLALYVSIANIPNQKIKASGDTYKSEGTANPNIGVIKRFHTQKENGHALFIEAMYSPDIIEAKDSSTTKKGNVARGGPQLLLNITAGKKIEDNQHSFKVNLQLNGATEEKPASGSGKNEADASNVIFIVYNYQKDINKQFSLNTALGWAKYSATESISSEDSKLETDGYTQIGYDFGAKYALTNDFVLSLTYESVVKQDIDGVSNGTDFTYEDLDSNSFTVLATYKF